VTDVRPFCCNFRHEIGGAALFALKRTQDSAGSHFFFFLRCLVQAGAGPRYQHWLKDSWHLARTLPNAGTPVVLQVIQATPQFRKTSVFNPGNVVMTRSKLSG
jgi:hypothetical protein